MSLFRIGPDRADELHGVIAACFEEGASDYWNTADLAEILGSDNYYGYSSRSDEMKTAGEYQGFIVAKIIGDEAEILSLAVLPAHRRTGIARALVGAAMADPLAREAEKWSLEVRGDNQAAIKLYEALDFSAVGRRPNYYWDARGIRSDALTMRMTAKS